MDSSEVTLKLIKRNGATFLSSTIGSVRWLLCVHTGALLFPCPWHLSLLALHFVTLCTIVHPRRPQFSSSGATRPIVQEMPVSIRPAEDIALVEPPALETPDVAIYMPDIKTLRAVVERMKSLRWAQRPGSGFSHITWPSLRPGPLLTLCISSPLLFLFSHNLAIAANYQGELTLEIGTHVVSVRTCFRSLETPVWRTCKDAPFVSSRQFIRRAKYCFRPYPRFLLDGHSLKTAGEGGPNISTQDIASGNFSGATIDARSLSHFLAGALLVQNPQHLLLGNYLRSV
jgi:hypothetical protein